MATISPLSLVRNGEVDDRPPNISEVRRAARDAADAVIKEVEKWAVADGDVAFRDVETSIRTIIFAFARAVLVLFLALREERVMSRYSPGERVEASGHTYRRAPAIARNLTTMFGVVRYFRTYMREVNDGPRCGFHPLDQSLGLPADRFSWNVLAKATWLATKLSFAEARSTLAEFVPNTPSTEVIENATLGFGRFAEDWFQTCPAPEDDGEVLVMMFDSKGIPTATEAELVRRRGKRRRQKRENSPRHRGRKKRRRHPKKPRRKKGDKSKNAKCATMVVMYTLKREGTRRLVGPINKWVYASFTSKEHTFKMARLEANKRGFAEGSGKLVQVVTDGDTDLAVNCAKYFPSAEHTIDVWHVVEYLWEAGRGFFQEGSKELRSWVKAQESRLFDGRVDLVLRELERRLAATPTTGPGNKGRRKRLAVAVRYIMTRKDKMNYGSLRRRDLEISTGPVEGAVKNVIGKRQDHGGMRWIPERAEALLKLRCIEVTGNWERFERYVHDRMHREGLTNRQRLKLQQDVAQPLPYIAEAA
jgi:hypothetical protein